MTATSRAIDKGLVGHWPLRSACRDASGSGLVVRNNGVDFGARGPDGAADSAAVFNGVDAHLAVSPHEALDFGTGEFSISAFIRTDEESDVVGDIVSKFDPVGRRGLNFYVLSNLGVTSTAQPNRRSLQFGIDNARMDEDWTDHGRLGDAVFVRALAVHDGALYAGTAEKGKEGRGHLWRYEGDGWADLGTPPDGSSAVTSIIGYKGELLLSSGQLGPEGSNLGKTENPKPGKTHRVGCDGTWRTCGPASSALTVYDGHLYALSQRGILCHEGGRKWQIVGPPELRFMTMAVYRGHLYALANRGQMLRYEGGSVWSPCGCPPGVTQMYSAAIHGGNLYIGTWPRAQIFQYRPDMEPHWKEAAQAFYEAEIMGMAICNGKLYAGSLPMGNVWRYDAHQEFAGDQVPVTLKYLTFAGNIEQARVSLKRVWSMAVYQGRLFAGTLPSGRVWSREFGTLATVDRPLPGGWRHVAAVRGKDRLRVYIDGDLTAVSSRFSSADYDLTTEIPFQIGHGMHTYFKGAMSDLRIYRRSLRPDEVKSLAGRQG